MTAFQSSLWPVALAPFIGSFLGVVVKRAEHPSGIIVGRSVCDHCGARLGVRDLVPLLSWALARGRCRHCGQTLGLFYPAIELAALTVAIWAAFVAEGPLLWVSCGLGWVLLALAATDFEFYLLPDFLTLPLAAAGLAAAWTFDRTEFSGHVIGAAAGLFVIIGIHYLYRAVRGREGIGLGDAKLFAVAGAWISWVGLPSVMLLAAVTALVYALARHRLVARNGLKDLPSGTDRVPFGAFLCLGIWVVWLYGPIGIG
jgi:leader peptidase (prepilin peptidase)/N-methyltransferase